MGGVRTDCLHLETRYPVLADYEYSPLANTPLPCTVPCHPPIMRSLTLLLPPGPRSIRVLSHGYTQCYFLYILTVRINVDTMNVTLYQYNITPPRTGIASTRK